MKKSFWILGGDGLNLKPNHRKAQNSILPGRFFDPYGRPKEHFPYPGDSWIIVESWKRFSEAMSNQRSKEHLEIDEAIALELLPGIFAPIKE